MFGAGAVGIGVMHHAIVTMFPEFVARDVVISFPFPFSVYMSCSLLNYHNHLSFHFNFL